ncbi:MAG: HD domain-containing protein [Deltaproteobacteria bacterium]|nr:HD domain-containing protein [Deltaproteobacteria bacterium]
MEEKRFIADLQENESCDSSFLVKAKTLGKTRSGNPFLRIRLGDQTGETEGRIWERALEFDQGFSVNDVVRVRARVERYQDKLQLNISDIERIDPEEVDPTLFLPKSPHDVSELWQQFEDLAGQVKNRHLQRLLQSFLLDRTFVEQMKQAPAAKSMHHAYLGGLLEHTVSVTRLMGRICDHYPRLDRDLLITAAILHDIGKLEEFSYQMHLDYTDAGRLLGHVVLGVQRVQEKIDKLEGFPPTLSLTLQHLMVSHHGEYEFGAPKRPKTLEAFALHYADDLDAKMNHLASLLDNEKESPSHWTPFQQVYDRFVFKGTGEGQEIVDSQADTSKDEVEPENYSFLDMLDSPAKGEER